MNSINQPKSLEQRVRTIEGYIITISGPALCISGVVAGLDVVTNNFIRNYAPQVGITLGVIWAVCLMISLDFQVLVLGVRARRVYISNKGNGKKAFEMALAFAIALALGYVSLQMGSIFSRMMGTSLSMEQAVTQGPRFRPKSPLFDSSPGQPRRDRWPAASESCNTRLEPWGVPVASERVARLCPSA